MGRAFYDQGLIFDATANFLGFVTSWSSKWTIGSNRSVPGSLVYGTDFLASNPTGLLNVGFVTSLRLNP